jgi:hypothetical protein
VRKNANSGQIFIVAVLTITLVLVSTEIYVYETISQTVDLKTDSFPDFVFMTKLGCRNTLISSLTSISVGSSFDILSTNLETLDSLIETQYQFGKCFLNYTLRSISPYSNGIWISWGSSGTGVSGAYANFTFKVTDREVNATVPFFVNVTTSVSIVGTYQRLTGNDKQVNVTCNLLNEGKPAIAKDITIYYFAESSWQEANLLSGYSVSDYGNGTYLASFVASIPGNQVNVSTQVYDTRQTFVRTNTTCTQV